MFESIINFFKNIGKKEEQQIKSKDAAKERLHLVLMQDRANVSADFLDLMKQEIIEVIKKYIDVDENAIDVRLTNKSSNDGLAGAPALYANIPIVSIKEDVKNKMARQKNTSENEENIKADNTENVVDSKEETPKENIEQKEKMKNKEESQEQNNGENLNEQTKEESVENKEDKNKQEEAGNKGEVKEEIQEVATNNTNNI